LVSAHAVQVILITPSINLNSDHVGVKPARTTLLAANGVQDFMSELRIIRGNLLCGCASREFLT
jgi:hypothetical protein